jgi:hypothetical protein
MATYQGLLIRDNFQDNGINPPVGDLYTSPDIIPYQNATLDWATAASTYKGPDIGKAVIDNTNNNIYIRGWNIGSAPITATVDLYYADASLFLLPSTWTHVVLPVADNTMVNSSSGAPVTTIQPNTMALTQAPFNLDKLANPNVHYCFIAVANNNGVETPIPASFPSNAAFSLWVQDNPGVGWRNIVRGTPSQSTSVSYQTFGNANPVQNSFIFSMQGVNLPAGTAWAANCNDQRLSKPYASSGLFSSTGGASTLIDVPANIGNSTGNALMNMAFTFTAPGGQAFPSNASVVVTYYQVPTTSVRMAYERLAAQTYIVPSWQLDDNGLNASGAQSEPQTLILVGTVKVLL